MEISQLGLFYLLVYSAFGGVLLGILCELMCSFRFALRSFLVPDKIGLPRLFGKEIAPVKMSLKSKKSSAFARLFCEGLSIFADALFVIISALALILIAYARNSGRMRWMLVVGLAIGFFAFRTTVGKIIRRILCIAILIFRNILVRIVKFLCVPVRRTCAKLKCILSKKNLKKKMNKKTKGGLRCEK